MGDQLAADGGTVTSPAAREVRWIVKEDQSVPYHFPLIVEEDLTFAHVLDDADSDSSDDDTSSRDRESASSVQDDDDDDRDCGAQGQDESDGEKMERGSSLEHQLVALRRQLRDEDEKEKSRKKKQEEKKASQIGVKLRGKYPIPYAYLCLLPYKRRRVVIEDDAFGGALVSRSHEITQAAKALEEELFDQGQYDVLIGSFHLSPTMSEAAANEGGSTTPPRLGDRLLLPLASPYASLFVGSKESPVGIEGHGDIVDSRLRKSKEVSLYDHSCIEGLHLDPMFGEGKFPDEMLRKIHDNLAPTAGEIRAIPYKALLYEKNDFFGMHVDSMHHPDQFGSLAVEIPLAKEDYEYDSSSSEGDTKVCDNMAGRYTSLKKEQASDQEDEADPRGGDLVFYSGRVSDDLGHYPRMWKPKDYSSYFTGTPKEYETVKKFMPPNTEGLSFLRGTSCSMKYYRPQNDRSQMITRFSLQSKSEAYRQRRKLAAKRWEYNNSWTGHKAVAEGIEGNEEEDGDDGKSREVSPPEGSVELKWAAWLTDVPHEVRRLRKGSRVSFVYNLVRVKSAPSRPLHVPREQQILQKAQDFFSLLHFRRAVTTEFGEVKAEELTHRFTIKYKKEVEDVKYNNNNYVWEDVESFKLKRLGVILRHQYPAGNFTPNVLKGVDAVLYHTLMNQGGYDIRLCLASESRMDLPDAPFSRETATWKETKKSSTTTAGGAQVEEENDEDGHDDAQKEKFSDYDIDAGKWGGESLDYGDHPLYRQVFAGDVTTIHDTNLRWDNSDRRIRARLPIIPSCIWIQLGLGELLTGGSMTGNSDCGSDWWYRSAVMIITSSTWSQRRIFVLVGLRGPKTMRRLFQVKDVFQHILSFV